MKNLVKSEMNVNGINIRITQVKGEDYISLTDLARHKNIISRN